jgi:hypothetical protein
MNYQEFFWWLDGYLSTEKNDLVPIVNKMKEVKASMGKEVEDTPKDKDRCVCGYNCGGDDCQ